MDIITVNKTGRYWEVCCKMCNLWGTPHGTHIVNKRDKPDDVMKLPDVKCHVSQQHHQRNLQYYKQKMQDNLEGYNKCLEPSSYKYFQPKIDRILETLKEIDEQLIPATPVPLKKIPLTRRIRMQRLKELTAARERNLQDAELCGMLRGIK